MGVAPIDGKVGRSGFHIFSSFFNLAIQDRPDSLRIGRILRSDPTRIGIKILHVNKEVPPI
ncbi:hypothetical protein Taro_046569 [Colocasia esculenta]|uniref:Uncharacterized protein n=1 Tax=Colocasia esculenta TaxID=4460 RepID=A0A843WQB3_COLES|nr:hypothetical protein [Colocasia esculenta]